MNSFFQIVGGIVVAISIVAAISSAAIYLNQYNIKTQVKIEKKYGE